MIQGAQKTSTQKIKDEPTKITADMKVGNRKYHFAFYTSDSGPDLCIISNEKNEVLALQKENNKWIFLKAARSSVLKKELIAHATALYHLQEK
ncbi:hypothetical protein [Niabella ginsengisoli]|uniref:Lipocalin-like domain-containing protein n=1 Tax=Niabella ginsengisoli TaxID=522298 RepID=A0ABS9SH82_9BACT|nr:hypothetical protein [Niabella ginsengisoli]MCH5597514.1 hypothetical protein [Niabella ginsengisoli]